MTVNTNLHKANIGWFTNLDVAKRHEELPLRKNYTTEKYQKYDNYDVINVDKTSLLKDIIRHQIAMGI